MLQHPIWEMIPKFLSSYEPFSFFSSQGYLSGSEGEERKKSGGQTLCDPRGGSSHRSFPGTPLIDVAVIYWKVWQTEWIFSIKNTVWSSWTSGTIFRKSSGKDFRPRPRFLTTALAQSAVSALPSWSILLWIPVEPVVPAAACLF